MNIKKSIIIIVIIALFIVIFNSTLGEEKSEDDMVKDYYIKLLPELKKEFKEKKFKDISITKQLKSVYFTKKAEISDIFISIDKILYDVEEDKIILIYHLNNLKEEDKIHYIRGALKDPQINSRSNSIAMGNKKKVNQGLRIDDKFYSILAFQSLRNENRDKYKPNKCNLDLNIAINSKKFKLYDISLDL